MVSRRSVLASAAALAVPGCSGTADVLGLRRTVRVAVSWGGAELRAFRSVLDGLAIRAYGVEVLPLGDDISTAFGPRSARRPDVVMLPQPGLVRAHLDALEPLPGDLIDHARSPLLEDLLMHRGNAYGLPFKVANKSAVWYRPSVFRRYGFRAPQRWGDWLTIIRVLASEGMPPLSLAAGDSWVLTDFFENIFLGTAPARYRALATSPDPRPSRVPEVSAALWLLGSLWAIRGALAGGVERCLTQQFPDAVVEVFGHRRAAMVVAPDFAELVVREFAADPDDVGVFPFPTVSAGARPPVVVGGDVAVLPKPAGDEARDLVRRLADPAAVEPWVRAGGFLVDGKRDGYSAQLSELAAQLVAPGNEPQFDLSDRLGSLGGESGLWRVLRTLLVAVGNRGPDPLPDAVAAAIDMLREAEK